MALGGLGLLLAVLVTSITALGATAGSSASAPAPGGTGFGARVVAAAEGELGVPYVWGGGDYTGPTDGGFDCSGLVMYALARASNGAVHLPHSSEADATLGQAVTPVAMAPGDVIAFDLHTNGTFDHVGIFVGGGQIVDAPYTGAVVRLDPLSAFVGHPWAIRSFG